MLHDPGHAERLRVLALFPHPRHVGHVVLDEDGLVARGSFACRTRRFPTLALRTASLERLIRGSLRRYKPTIVVIVQARGCAWLDAMMAHAITVVDATGRPLRIRYEAALTSLLVDDDVQGYDQLGQVVTRVFFPELARGVRSWRRGEEDRRRRPRAVWKAAAGAIAVLAENRPAAVAALARAPLPTVLASFIEHALHPPIV